MGFIEKITKSQSQILARKVTDLSETTPPDYELRRLATFTNQGETAQIMKIICQRLNDKGKNWRRLEKSLSLLNYLLRFGNIEVVSWYHNNNLLIQSLQQYYQNDESGKDIAYGIRDRASDIVGLVSDKHRLNIERDEARIEFKRQELKHQAYIRKLEREALDKTGGSKTFSISLVAS